MADPTPPPASAPVAVSAPQPTPPDFGELYLKTGQVFSPSAPIDQRSLFAGRIEQLAALADAVRTKGQHAIVYGERGVGKTSLVSILQHLTVDGIPLAGMTTRHNCHSDDTFARLWYRAFQDVSVETQKSRIGFTQEQCAEVRSIAEECSDNPTPDEITRKLRRLNSQVIFIFDEFDQLQDKSVPQAFTELIKALSDYAVPAKIILVGIGDTVDELIKSHASIERAVRQVKMPRMPPKELSEIISNAMRQLKMTIASDAESRVVRLSQGLPHYVHSIGMQAARVAIDLRREHIRMEHATEGIRQSLQHATQSLLDTYLKATYSPQADSLYCPVLLACALAKSDELTYFTPAAIRECLKAMGRNLEIPAFASHLAKFALPERGPVLQKTGTQRRFRYRFISPLLQPYVVMKGISDGLIQPDKADALLSSVPMLGRAPKR